MKVIKIEEFIRADKKQKIEYCIKIIKGQASLERRESNMPRVNIIETRVKELLRFYPGTRENDNLLYIKYIKEYHYTDFNEDTFVNYKEKGIPSYKSIERARKRIQNEQMAYQANEDVQKDRQETEDKYREEYKY